MLIRSRDRLGTVYLDSDDFRLVRGMPPTKSGEWTYIGLKSGDSIELNEPLARVLEWWGWEGDP